MNDLWQRYTRVLHGKGITPPFDRWYVIRAEEFLKNHKGKRLSNSYWLLVLSCWLLETPRVGRLNRFAKKLYCICGIAALRVASCPHGCSE